MRIVSEHISDKKVVLEMKSWRNHFKNDEIKDLIAIAINRTICETNTRLKGYFISDERIYFVLHVLKEKKVIFINYFLNELHKVLIRHAVLNDELDFYFKERDLYNNVKKLFDYHDFFDARLYHLLIGKEEGECYDDPVVEEMTDYLTTYKYSSYRNYKGEKGPVIFPVSKRRVKRKRNY